LAAISTKDVRGSLENLDLSRGEGFFDGIWGWKGADAESPFQGKRFLGACRLLRMPPVNRLVGPSWGPPSDIASAGSTSDGPGSSTGGDVATCRA
jgi:hypothetical protein